MASSLHSHVVEHLGSRIVNGSITPGTVLLAAELERELRVSRSVVREAVRALAQCGLVTSTKRVGIRVQGIEKWNPFDSHVVRWRLAADQHGTPLRSLTELRMAVEPMAAELAARHAPLEYRDELAELAAQLGHHGRAAQLQRFLEVDQRFHSLLLAASGNEMFARLWVPIGETVRGRGRLGLMPERPSDQVLDWHQAAADAIRGQNPVAARENVENIMRLAHDELCGTWAGQDRLFIEP